MFIEQVNFVPIAADSSGKEEVVKHPDQIKSPVLAFIQLNSDIFEIEIESKGCENFAHHKK